MEKMSRRQKFFCFYEILKEYSGERHPLSFEEINEHFKVRCGESTNIKAVRSYIEDLRGLGMEILNRGEDGNGYYLIDRRFEPWELKMMIDAISRNYSISRKKTQTLVNKIAELHNVYTRYSLNKEIDIRRTPKTVNEQVPYNLDKLRLAIEEKKKVRFLYYSYNEKHKLIPREKDGVIREYIGSPYALFSKKNCNYSILNMDNYSRLSNYRVDRMKNVKILEQDVKPLKEIWGYSQGLNIEEYAGKCFLMFVGREIKVTMEINKSLLNSIFEELGDQVKISKKDQGSDTYLATFSANEGDGLVRWVLQLGDKARVVAPDSLVEQIGDMISAIEKRYQIED